MVKDHSESEKGNPLPPHRLLFSINSKGSFISTDRIAHTPVVEHWLEREILSSKLGKIKFENVIVAYNPFNNLIETRVFL